MARGDEQGPPAKKHRAGGAGDVVEGAADAHGGGGGANGVAGTATTAAAQRAAGAAAAAPGDTGGGPARLPPAGPLGSPLLTGARLMKGAGGAAASLPRPSATQLGELFAGATADALREIAGGAAAGDESGDEEDGDEPGEEEENMRAAIKKVIEAREAKAQRKLQHQLAQLQAHVAEQVAQVEAAVQRDATEASAALAAMVKGLKAKLDARHRGILELEVRFQKELSDKWEEYNEEYSSNLEDIQTQAQKLLAKRTATHKKRLDAVAAEATARLAELEQRSARTKSRSEAVMPQLASVLKAML